MDPVIEIKIGSSTPITHDERPFFVQLGTRIAALRKDQGLTQVQLAESLELSQQTVTAYELGHRRMAISLLPPIARLSEYRSKS